jgi:hypothetical protein
VSGKRGSAQQTPEILQIVADVNTLQSEEQSVISAMKSHPAPSLEEEPTAWILSAPHSLMKCRLQINAAV